MATDRPAACSSDNKNTLRKGAHAQSTPCLARLALMNAASHLVSSTPVAGVPPAAANASSKM